MSEMLRFHLVLAMSGFLVTMPVGVALPYPDSVRLGDASKAITPTLFDAVSMPEVEDVTEQEQNLFFNEGTPSEPPMFGPGSKCNQSSHCAAVLICTAPGTCACPTSAPVLLIDKNSFACVLPRRLRESCVSHDECSYGNERARCLDSTCLCPQRFVPAPDRSFCIPEPVVWLPLRAAMFPAVLLILASLILALYGYYRLTTPDGSKPETHQDVASKLVSHGSSVIRHIRKWTVEWPVKRHYVGSTSYNLSRLRGFLLGVTQMPKFTISSWQLPKYNRFGQKSDPAEKNGKEEPIAATASRSLMDDKAATVTTHEILSDTSGAIDTLSLRPAPSVPVATRRVRKATTQVDPVASQHPPAPMNDDRTPIPSRRTKIATLSTYTMMPCRAKRGRDLNMPSASPAAEAATARPFSAYRAGRHNASHGTAEPACANYSNLQPLHSQQMPYFYITESDLPPRWPLNKCKSEVAQKPVIGELYRAASAIPDPTPAIVEEIIVDQPVPYSSSMEPCMQSSESSTRNTYSYMELIEDESNESGEYSELLTYSLPTWAHRHASMQRVYQSLRACKTFTVHNVSGLQNGKALLMGPVGNAAAYRGAPPYISSRWPPTTEQTRWRRGPMTYAMAPQASASAGAPASTGFVLSIAASRNRVHCAGEAAIGPRPVILRGLATTDPVSDTSSHDTRLMDPPQLDRRSVSLDSPLLAAMMRAERRAKGSNF